MMTTSKKLNGALHSIRYEKQSLRREIEATRKHGKNFGDLNLKFNIRSNQSQRFHNRSYFDFKVSFLKTPYDYFRANHIPIQIFGSKEIYYFKWCTNKSRIKRSRFCKSRTLSQNYKNHFNKIFNRNENFDMTNSWHNGGQNRTILLEIRVETLLLCQNF